MDGRKNLSAERLGNIIGVDRSTIWRWCNEQWRLDLPKMDALADALGIKIEDLFRPPGRPSVDAVLKNASQDLYEATFALARRLVPDP